MMSKRLEFSRRSRPTCGSPRPAPMARRLLLVVLLASLLELFEEAACFSTPVLRKSSARQVSGDGGNSARGIQQPDEMYEYTNNYIMAIEDRTTQPAGFMVSTTDFNYAVQSPLLSERGWQSLTLNGMQAFILTNENETKSVNLFRLSEDERDFISEIRGRFTNNLAGLKFAYYTSGSTLALAGGPSAPSFKYDKQAKRPDQRGVSIASENINKLNDAKRLASLQELSKRRGIRLYEPQGGRTDETLYSLGGGGAAAKQPATNGSADEFFGERGSGKKKTRRTKKRAGGGSARSLALDETPVELIEDEYLGSSSRLEKRQVAPAAVQWHAPSGRALYLPHDIGGLGDPAAYAPAHLAGSYSQNSPSAAAYQVVAQKPNYGGAKPTIQNGICAFQSLINFNYYNLNSGEPHAGARALNQTLAGDIYYFDFHCNILDVYSSTVSVRQIARGSILYRDHRYFSYARSKLPLEINRFFLVGDQVFLVYNDGSLLLKQSWMLEPLELEFVLSVRQDIKNMSEWQANAARLIGGKKPAPAASSQEQQAAAEEDDGSEGDGEPETSTPSGQAKEKSATTAKPDGR